MKRTGQNFVLFVTLTTIRSFSQPGFCQLDQCPLLLMFSRAQDCKQEVHLPVWYALRKESQAV